MSRYDRQTSNQAMHYARYFAGSRILLIGRVDLRLLRTISIGESTIDQAMHEVDFESRRSVSMIRRSEVMFGGWLTVRVIQVIKYIFNVPSKL